MPGDYPQVEYISLGGYSQSDIKNYKDHNLPIDFLEPKLHVTQGNVALVNASRFKRKSMEDAVIVDNDPGLAQSASSSASGPAPVAPAHPNLRPWENPLAFHRNPNPTMVEDYMAKLRTERMHEEFMINPYTELRRVLLRAVDGGPPTWRTIRQADIAKFHGRILKNVRSLVQKPP